MRYLTLSALTLAVAAALCAVAGWHEQARCAASGALLAGGFRLAYGWLADAQTHIPDTNEPPCGGFHPNPKDTD